MRLLVLALAAILLAGCSGDASSRTREPSPDRPVPTAADDPAARTPTELRHPCAAVPARVAGRLVGQRMHTEKVTSELAPRTLECSYAAGRDRRAPVVEIRSTPDPTSLEALVRLYLGVDRLPHHPVEVAGADDAEAIRDPDNGLVTVFAKQGFVTHTVVLHLNDAERGERLALRLAALVVRRNR